MAAPFHNEMKVKGKELEPCHKLQMLQQQRHLQELFQQELYTLMAIHIRFAFEMSQSIILLSFVTFTLIMILILIFLSLELIL